MITKLTEDNINADRNAIIRKVNELIDVMNTPAPKAAPKKAAAKKTPVKKKA